MILSSNVYNNSPYSIETELTLGQKNYRKTKELPTTKKNIRFHYEFWYMDGDLYACIHCDHKNADPDFIKYIQDVFHKIIKPNIVKQGILIPANTILIGQSDRGNKGINTHTINLKCIRGEAENNASLLKSLIKNSYGILSRY